MAKRREVTAFLRESGFHPTVSTSHEHWTDGVHFTQVPRHREISEPMFEKIKKQAGLK